ncbi:MAG TPA: acetolactate decarboxylase, partial [Methanoregula sp.]|nr:acetolactate decarboxylase [Methanoregula sp.]
MDRKLFYLGIGLAVVLVFCGISVFGSVEKVLQPHPDRETFYQVSTMGALAGGAFAGVQPVSELKKHGDFGIGTFDGLNGEMIVLDGNVYQAFSNGTVATAPEKETVPFAMVTWFDRDSTVITDRPMNYTGLTAYLTAALPSDTMIYAVRIHGTFPEMTVRSIPQQQRPYPSLVAAAANQSVYSSTDAKGTIVGFFLPGFMSGPNMAGYHLHFISDDRKTGGHVLDFSAGADTIIELDATPQIFI